MGGMLWYFRTGYTGPPGPCMWATSHRVIFLLRERIDEDASARRRRAVVGVENVLVASVFYLEQQGAALINAKRSRRPYLGSPIPNQSRHQLYRSTMAAGKRVGVRARAANQFALDDGSAMSRLGHVPSQKFTAFATTENEHFIVFRWDIVPSSESEIAQRRVVIGAAAQRPMVFAIALLDRKIVDAGYPQTH